MPFFPIDFLEPDGRFRDLLPADFVPILYLAADGGVLCAACVNNVRPTDLDPDCPDDAQWMLVGYDLLYEGPLGSCDHCGRDTATLYGDPDEG